MPKLLRSRRFLPLFLAQALGALNDNLFKNALVVLIAFRDLPGASALVALAGGLFILPYLIVSATAGQLADRIEKPRLIRLLKVAELLISAAGALSLLLGSVPLLLAVLFALGVQAAFFGPVKYGILPELLAPADLLRGNALVESATFAAILLGTVAGGLLIGLQAGPALVGAAGLALALLGLVAALLIPPHPPAAPGLRVGWNPAAETRTLLRAASRDRPVWTAILALSWFWALGATFLAEFPILAARSFGADNRVVTALLAAFVLGIGFGSAVVGRALRADAALRAVPVAALLLSACTFAFAALAALPDAASWTTPAAMLGSPTGLLALLALLGAASSGGVYSVPLYALIQRRADPAERARTIGANNVMNALFMVLGAAALAALAALGLPPQAILAAAGALNLLAVFPLARALRRPEVAAAPTLRHEGA